MFYSFLFVGVYHYQRGDLPELCILFVNHIHFYFGDAVCMGLPVGLRVGLGRWRVLSSGAWGGGAPGWVGAMGRLSLWGPRFGSNGNPVFLS